MALQTKNVIFTAEKTDLQGYLAWNEDQDGSRPAVLVFPEWWGLNNYIKKRTEQVASLGYLAMGVDMYGCLLYTSPSPRDATLSRMPSSA